MKRLLLLLAPIWLVACEQQPAGEPVVRTELGEAPAAQPADADAAEAEAPEVPQPASACTALTFEDTAFTHCIADPERHTIRTALAPAGGQPFGSLAAFAETAEAGSIAFAMTGGAFGDDLRAVGYYVEDGERLSELDRADGEGNFYMKPNGVFFGTGDEWRAMASEAFFATVRDRPQFGTQSGPMLVTGGELHPDFEDNGPSRAVRSGVGVDRQGRAHFVIAEDEVSFGRIARLFRDELETPEALMLQSGNSALWDPASGRLDQGRAGPILVVEEKP
ncbi:MAG: phosphodiester glycosidase family protein [Erythrobacter sp.]